MYNLEGGVIWTQELKNAFKTGTTYCSVIHNQQEYNESNFLKEAELKDVKYVPNAGFIGQAVSKMLTIKMVNDEESNLNFENANVQFKIGAKYNDIIYYINYGNFIVNEPPENDDTNGTVKFIAYDYMIKFNQDYTNRVSYPCKLKDLLLDICSQAGVELGSTTFQNEDFEVEDNQFEGKQLRDVLQHIAKCAFSWARIGQDNKLYLDFEVNNNIDEIITIDDYKMDAFKKANEYYGPINKVTYADSDIKGQEISVQDDSSIATYGEKEIIIYDNYFAYNTKKRQKLIQAGTVLFGLRYMPVQNLELIGLVYLDCTDIIGVQDGAGTTYLTRVFSHIIKYNGVVSDTIETTGESDNEKRYSNSNNSITQNSRTEIIVDRAKKEITAVIEEVAGQNRKIAKVTQTVDELNSKIQNIADITIAGETMQALLQLDNINESEPISINIHPIGTNISYLYPRNNLYPSDTLYMTDRKLRFIRTYIESGETLTETIDYELPDDLLYYDSNNYDEFILNYDSQVCQVRKKCKYNADGTVSLLSNEVVTDYPYPTILLKDGDYEIKLLGYNVGYLFVRLMAQNIYTTQFATKVELNSEITQTANTIMTSVNQKVGKTEVGTYIEQNTESVKLAWNQISEYIQMMIINNNASFAILDSSKKPIAYFDKTGIHFSSNNTAFGEMGVQTVDGNKFIAFSVDGTYGSAINNGMAWGIKTTSDNKFHPIFYIKNFEMGSQQSDAGFGELVLSASNLLLDGIGTGLITGGVKIFGDPTAGGMYFYDVNKSKYLMQIFPDDGLSYGEIQILDNMNFFRNSNGSNSFQIGAGEQYCLFTDDGAIRGNYLYIVGNGTFTGYLDVGNNINCDGNVYAQNISDRRLKKNIKDVEDNALDNVKKMKVRSFDWKKDDSHVSYGFIAQELEEIDKCYVLKQEVKNDKGETTDYKYYQNEFPIIATLTKAIQEQQTQIEELQKEIKELKGGK